VTNHPTVSVEAGTANLSFARVLVGELHAAGVAFVYVCPGSRSTPLALAVADRQGLPFEVHVDERSAAFHALGRAKATGKVVALICTSGTAAANFLPAVAEASHARVPLVVLTADRPPELRAWGAPQTMEQRTLYTGFVRWSEEAPCPSESAAGPRYARALARRAVTEATGPSPGPVHLNLPFREPLVPSVFEPAADDAGAVAPSADTTFVHEVLDPAGSLAGELRRATRGVLVCGPDAFDDSFAPALAQVATALGWPVIADPASGLRAGEGLGEFLISGADLLLREPSTAEALSPELVVRFGGQPTSAALTAWLGRHGDAGLWLVDPAGGHRDPQHRAGRTLRLDARQLQSLLVGAHGSPAPGVRAWLERWQHADRVARAAAGEMLAAEPRLLGPQIAQVLWASLPDGAALYVANSMPIREIDAFAGPRAAALRVLANRGVNGIDGLMSSALGAGAGLGVPTVLWCGDLALLHDVAGLVAGRMHATDLTVVVSNDDGGGIFEFLPVARAVPREVFESLFAVPHGLDLVALARGFGWHATRVDSSPALQQALATSLRGGLHLIEVPVDRATNTAFHAALHARVAERLRAEPPP